MKKIYKDWKRNRQVKKIKEGDGHRIRPFRFWEIFSRTMFHINLMDEEGESRRYSVTVNFFGYEEAVKLFKDGRHQATSEAPASFPVPGGYIEVGVSTAGLTRMHYVSGEKEEVLSPNKGTAEYLRNRFGKRFPITSRVIGMIAVVILLISLVFGIPQLIEYVSHIEIIRDNIGTFTSPLQLPGPLNMTLLILAALAAMERALTLKNHWLIDMETTIYDD